MIRINLLPVRAAKKREFGRQQIVFLVLILVLAGIGNYFWYNKVDGDLTGLDQQIARTRSEIAQLEKTIGEVKSMVFSSCAISLREKTIGEVKSIKEDKEALEDKL